MQSPFIISHYIKLSVLKITSVTSYQSMKANNSSTYDNTQSFFNISHNIKPSTPFSITYVTKLSEQ